MASWGQLKKVCEMQVQHFALVSDKKIGTWGIPLVKLSWSKDFCLKKTNHPKTVPMDMLHTSILLKYQLPQLVENRSCLFSPCSVGCAHRCETVKCCPRGSAILLCKWIQRCDILLAGTGGTYENLTDCHRFAWWIDWSLLSQTSLILLFLLFKMTFSRGGMLSVFFLSDSFCLFS